MVISVLIEQYLMESGAFATAVIDALLAAAERNVSVFLVLDHFGTLGLNYADRQRLLHPAIHVIWYNPLKLFKWIRNFHRNHRKFLLVDQQVAFVGGMCIVDQFWSGPDLRHLTTNDHIAPKPWLDVVVTIKGPILRHWYSLFQTSWNKVTKQPMSVPSLPAITAGTMVGRVSWSSGHTHQDILKEFVRRARKARRRIYIATPYFVPSWNIRRTLIRAAKNGVDVRLLLPGPETDHPGVRYAAWRYYRKLLRHGVKINEYQPAFIHAKVILCDDWSSIGSCNLDHWNQRWNLEANQEVEDVRFARQVEQFFEMGWEESEEQLLRNWQKPYWRKRLLAYLWGKVDGWLMRLN
jgi:cardiolipin synthase A/B